MPPIRLLLVDDHSLFRESLARLLESEPGFEMLGSCANVTDALALVERNPIDVVLLDFDLGRETGNSFLIAARAVAFRGRVLLVTAGMSEADCAQALKLGASGIFEKRDSPLALAQAIRIVAAGGTWLNRVLVQTIVQQADHPESSKAPKPLTERERQVLQGVYEGLSNKEIAQQLSASESAIKSSLQQLFAKCGVRTRSQLVRVALERSSLPG
ncbi:MAG: response regulator transcription factor [Bryobacteraceae bacterium]